MLISILTDKDSWILPYVQKLFNSLERSGHTVKIYFNYSELCSSDINFILGYMKVVPEIYLKKSHFNMVVHESDLPIGRGFAPMAWQIIEGRKEIVFSLLEANENVDSGDIWLQDILVLNGTELCDEWRDLQGNLSIRMCEEFVRNHKNIESKKQEGDSSYFPKRNPNDSELDIKKSIEEQINLLRVVDNNRYPAYFIFNDIKYKVTIEKSSLET